MHIAYLQCSLLVPKVIVVVAAAAELMLAEKLIVEFDVGNSQYCEEDLLLSTWRVFQFVPSYTQIYIFLIIILRNIIGGYQTCLKLQSDQRYE